MACALFTIAFTLPRGASRSLTLENYFNYFTEIEEAVPQVPLGAGSAFTT